LKHFSQNNYEAELEPLEIPRVGLIALSTDFTIEQDFRSVFHQQPVNLYVNRIPFENPMNKKNYLKMRDILPSITKNILPGESIDTIAYGCTSGTIAIGDKVIEKKICEIKNNCYVTTPITAALKAFEKFSINKIAVLTPYPDLVNKTIFNSDKDVAMLKKETIINTIKSINDEEAQAIFVSCTAMPILSLIKDIENINSKPIFSSNQVIIWDCLRSVKINKPIYGYGKLLELY